MDKYISMRIRFLSNLQMNIIRIFIYLKTEKRHITNEHKVASKFITVTDKTTTESNGGRFASLIVTSDFEIRLVNQEFLVCDSSPGLGALFEYPRLLSGKKIPPPLLKFYEHRCDWDINSYRSEKQFWKGTMKSRSAESHCIVMFLSLPRISRYTWIGLFRLEFNIAAARQILLLRNVVKESIVVLSSTYQELDMLCHRDLFLN